MKKSSPREISESRAAKVEGVASGQFQRVGRYIKSKTSFYAKKG